jgi:hypothetical protein
LLSSLNSTIPYTDFPIAGRGGAGNWVQPKELHSQGLSQKSSQDVPQRMLGSSKPTYKGGRGGAGNYGSLEEEEKGKRELEQRRREQVEKAVERDVESGLARPERTYGGQGGSWEMGDVSGQDRS